MFELKESDLLHLERLVRTGREWIAEDEDGLQNTYSREPEKGYGAWYSWGHSLPYDGKIFGINWSDPEPLNISAAIAQIKAQSHAKAHGTPSGCEWCNGKAFDRVGVSDDCGLKKVFLCGGNGMPDESERFKLCPMCGTPLPIPCEGGEKGMSEETVKALTQPSFDKLHSMFDLAWECNKSDETRTNLSRMVTDYITHVMQDYSWLIGIVEDISEDRLRELAAAEREGNIPKLKLGDKVYWPTGCFAFLYGEIAECTISMVSIGSNTKGWKYRAFMYPKAERARGKDQQDFSESEIGKEFFLTREAAEAALAGKETDNATANDTTTRSQSTQRDDDTPTARACG